MRHKILITGGAGFIGYNSAIYFKKKNHKVYVLDNLSRKGVEENKKRLKKKNIFFFKSDILKFKQLLKLIKKIKPTIIIHQAGQVTVTKSVLNPRHDLENNLIGTFNLLESIRILKLKCCFIYPSTNKVYGDLNKIEIRKGKTRYDFKNKKGINEQQPIDFHSPYGCSKGSADQYVMDYSKTFNIKSFVVRQSCIYGPNQYGHEDQGWISWILMCSIFKKKINIFGDGLQVRDILYIDDLIRLYELIILNLKNVQSCVINCGGGINNSLSIIELINFIKKNFSINVKISKKNPRVGDQKVYISNTSFAKKKFGWSPKVHYKKGLKNLFAWILSEGKYIKKIIK